MNQRDEAIAAYRNYTNNFEHIESKVRNLLEGGVSVAMVRRELAIEGFNETMVDQAIRHVGIVRKTNDRRHEDETWGLLWLMGGIGLTVATYLAAGPGGTFLVAPGPIIYGITRILRSTRPA